MGFGKVDLCPFSAIIVPSTEMYVRIWSVRSLYFFLKNTVAEERR